MKINESDWKTEKHVPYIEVAREGEGLRVEVCVGREIPHPNTPEHHISWLKVFFEDQDSNLFPLARVSFDGHGEMG